ncbi:type II toxin-antitoxin system RelE/ParE family toxin [Leptolyngbya sp. AN03gr2]|uniref:type II toxin-antitoxin system RelE/ParE family toxin n=1 Tax=unclassified Leptolyngbya TaxID=2650499 RepID=UPI003D310A6C
MAIVVKRPLAEQDLLEIWNYIAEDSPDRADEFLDQVEAKLEALARYPGMGRKREEIMPELQSFPVGNDVIFYRAIDGGIEVIRVLRGSRDVESILGQD